MSTPSPRTLLGPLTTTWSAPPICSYAMALCDTCTTVWQGQTCNPVSNAHDFTDCWPPRSGDQAHLDPGVMMGWGLYSPGIACPAGYVTAALATAGGRSGWGVEYEMLPGETAAACCPSGFSISWISASNTLAQTCVVTATSTSFVTVQCDSGTFVEFSAVTVPNTVSDRTLSSYVLFAPLYQLNFRASDVPASTTTSSSPDSASSQPTSTPPTLPTTGIPPATTGPSSLPSSSASSTTSSTGDGESAPPTPSPAPSRGLSPGAKAGIAIGAVLGALLLLALAILLFRLRRRKSTATSPSSTAANPLSSSSSTGPGGASANEKRRPPPPHHAELASEEVRELDGRPVVVAELPTRLPSDRRAPAPDRKRGTVFRRSDQGWVVSPTSPSGMGAAGFEEDAGGGGGGVVVSPVEPGVVFELEGDTTPRATLESGR